jgi:hypothetical protein
MLLRSVEQLSVALLLALLTTTAFAVSLIDVLIANGADQFALILEADPALLAFFLSSSVKIVFAPVDGYMSNNSGVLRCAENGGLTSDLLFQTAYSQETMAGQPQSRKRSIQLVGDKIVQTNLEDDKLAPNNQSIVAEFALSTNSTSARLLQRYFRICITHIIRGQASAGSHNDAL